jgi:hypothetical protein
MVHNLTLKARPTTPLSALAKLGTILGMTGVLAIAVPLTAWANPVHVAEVSDERTVVVAVPQEIDGSLIRTYEPATIYLPDPVTRELVPQVVPVAVDQPVATAVSQIVDSYQGQDIGIRSYEVVVNEPMQSAQIDFNLQSDRGTDAFLSLSSSNQFALFEAIRETLLTQPNYQVTDIIFSANGEAFEI